MASASGPSIPVSCEGCLADHRLPSCPSLRSQHLGKHLAEPPAFLSWFRAWEAGSPPAQMQQSGCGSSSRHLARPPSPPPAAGGLPARVAQAGAVGSVGLRVGPCGRVHAPGCTPRRGAARFTHPPAGTAQHPSHGMFSWSGSGFWSGVHFLVGTHLTHHHLGKDVARAP